MPLPIPEASLPPLERLRAVVHCLRAPGGCPWDREQTHKTLIPHLLEEAYEVAEAIREGDAMQIADELGDLLLQPVLHAEIAAESGSFDLDIVAGMITDKLIRRHPHVFAAADAADSEAVLKQWDEIKKQERAGAAAPKPSALDGVTRGLPSLMTAQKLQKKAAKVGFDWADAAPVIGKIREETDEICQAIDCGKQSEREHEVGDLLFSVVNLARKLGIDAEASLAAANARFERRFKSVETVLRERGKEMTAATLEEMDTVWEEIKQLEHLV